jgi:ABC-2 type transport system ATP-binding protein
LGVVPVIEVEHLVKRYGSTVAVDDVSFEVAEGEIFGILGPNGAGKTTTVECVQGLRVADGGRIRVLGLDPGAAIQGQALRRRIGCQLQESALPDRLKVWEALDLFSSLAPAPGATNWRVVLDQWGLGSKAKASFSSLSGGQRQRLFVALALINDPEVVFLDELTQGLDPAARRVAWGLIRQIRERGATVVLVTHYMDEAEQLCDRLAVVNHGRVVAVGAPQELVARFGGCVRVRFSLGHGPERRDVDLSWLQAVEHVTQVGRDGDQVEVEGSGPVLALVAAALVARGIVPPDLRAERASLEDVFLHLSGQAAGEATQGSDAG